MENGEWRSKASFTSRGRAVLGNRSTVSGVANHIRLFQVLQVIVYQLRYLLYERLKSSFARHDAANSFNRNP
jgi:hypothetical protein